MCDKFVVFDAKEDKIKWHKLLLQCHKMKNPNFSLILKYENKDTVYNTAD